MCRRVKALQGRVALFGTDWQLCGEVVTLEPDRAFRRVSIGGWPALGPVDVTVTAAGGTSANSIADIFTYAPIPTVSELGQASGPAIGGTLVRIIKIGRPGSGIARSYLLN